MTPREIDALLAEHVFGEPKPTEPADFDLAPIGIWRAMDIYGEPECRWEAPQFSTDPAAGDQFLDKMRVDGYVFSLIDDRDDSLYEARFAVQGNLLRSTLFIGQADTKWMAVALAALKACRVEVSQ